MLPRAASIKPSLAITMCLSRTQWKLAHSLQDRLQNHVFPISGIPIPSENWCMEFGGKTRFAEVPRKFSS